MAENEITYEVLNNLKYGNEMKAKLEELGVGEAWKGGAKKDDIINKALELLAKIKLGPQDPEGEPENEEPDVDENQETPEEPENEKPESEEEEKEEPKKEEVASDADYGYGKFDLETLLELRRKLRVNVKNLSLSPGPALKILQLKSKAIEKVIARKEAE